MTLTPCPTCQGDIRQTVGLVCQTCSRDYSATLYADTDSDVVAEIKRRLDSDVARIKQRLDQIASYTFVDYAHEIEGVPGE